MIQTQAMLEVAGVVLELPARLRPLHQAGDRGGGVQVRYPVATGSVLAVRPLHQEDPGGQDAVPPVAAAARPLGCGHRLLARGPDGHHRKP